MRNRLEHLRKRQRDEALQAQEELLEGVASYASRGVKVAPVAESTEDAPIPYDRSMSPALINITSLPYDERQVDIVLEAVSLGRRVIAYNKTSCSNHCHLIIRRIIKP